MEQGLFYCRIAGIAFAVQHRYSQVRERCRDYLVPDSEAVEAISLAITDGEIRSMCEEYPQNTPEEAEEILIYQKIAETAPHFSRLLVHGASVSYGANGYLFTAPSGTGKSTHIALWRKYLGRDVEIINGDKPMLWVEPPIRVCGTPWGGKENWQKNCSAPLSAICFLQQSKENRIRRLLPEEVLPLLLGQVFLPKDTAAGARTLELVDVVLRTVPLYQLSCDMSEAAVRCSFEAMTGLTYPMRRKEETV